jgi:tetratricopeptide (TPR) repeat protein
MSDSSLGRTIQERARILLKALLDYDPGMDSDHFKGILKGSLGKNSRSQRGYDQSQKLTFHVYSLSNQGGRRVEATVYSLAKLPGMLGERELTEEEVKDATRCLEKFEIIEQIVVKGKTERTLTLKYKDKGEILTRFEQKCQDWNAQNEAKSSKDPWTRVRHFVPPEFDLLDQKFFQKRQGGESKILELPTATWSLVTQGGYIERDQQGDALALAEELAESSGISLLLIRGEPGAGKTALMRWLAYELSSQERIVLQTKKEDLYWLEPLWEFSEQIGEQHFYLIADDLFRDASILDELVRNQLQFPLTLIGTTRLNEDQQDQLRMWGYQIKHLDLELSPSPKSQEKERILERIGQQDPEAKARLDQKTPAELEKLMAAPSMLVLMLQLSEGKPFDLIVADIIKRLPSEEDYPVYQVFGVICSFYQYGITTPPGVLPLCLPKYSSNEVQNVVDLAIHPEHPELKGLVNTISKLGYEGLATIHELIAQTAMTVKYSRSRGENLPYSCNSLEDHLRAAIQALDVSEETHKRWVYHGLRLLAVNGQANLVRQVLNDYPDQIQSLQQGNTVSGWFILARMYEAVGLLAERDHCLNAILSSEPQSSWEWEYRLSLIERLGSNQQKQEAIAQTSAWLEAHPENWLVRRQYIVLVEKQGTLEQKQKEIAQTTTWLEHHPQDWEVRKHYLTLIENYGTLKHKQAAIFQTSTWLQGHPNDWEVRTKYLALIGQCGTPEQKKQAIAQTATWLQQHSENTSVRTQYLALIGQCGTPEQKKQAIAQTTTWLQHHSEDTSVRTKYLALIGQCGTPEQKKQAIAQTDTWLQQHPEDVSVRENYLALIGKCGTPEQKREAITQTVRWLQNHTDDTNVRTQYLALIGQYGTIQQQREALAETHIWLEQHSEDTFVRTQYLALVGKTQKEIVEIEAVISQQWEWISQQQRVNQDLWTIFLPVLYYHAQLELIQEAVSLALKQYPENKILICLVFAYFRDELDYETCYQLADFLRQFRLPIDKWQNFIHAANFFRDYGDLDTAESIYQRILKAAEFRASKHGNDMRKTINFATLSYARLLLLRNPPDPYTAIKYLEPILAENPKHCVAHWCMAQCYRAKGHSYSTKGRKFYPQAINHFEKAIEFDQEKNGQFWYDFGCFYRNAMENLPEARKCFENSLNQKINLPACVDLAELEVQNGNFERARELLQKGLTLVPITRPEKEQREKLEPRIQQLQAQLGL